ncbi:thioredoxin-like-domain-containing protein [Baffinella frigidus]|nr:thioredoxin-like-domain-containing protein [Cryptophyta sp. CCMP2293]
MDLLASAPLVNAAGAPVAASSLKGLLVAFYFSAHWCPPCREFTPVLKDFYEAVNEPEKKFEVVFVSSDNDEAARLKYMKEAHGEWLSLPIESPLRDELKRKYGCCAGKEQQASAGVVERREGIPALVIVRPDGSEVSIKGTEEALGGPPALKRWLAKV